MSTLVRGMEMPKDCPYCPLAHWNFKNEFTGCEITKKYFSTEELYADGRPDFCPLVLVPEHGRLIDKDALEQDISESVVFSGRENNPEIYGANKIINRIHYAPVIIPAEEVDDVCSN